MQLQRSVLRSDNFLGSSQAPLSRLQLPPATLHSFNSDEVRQAISRGPRIAATKLIAATVKANRSMRSDSRVKRVEVSCGKSCNCSGICRLTSALSRRGRRSALEQPVIELYHGLPTNQAASHQTSAQATQPIAKNAKLAKTFRNGSPSFMRPMRAAHSICAYAPSATTNPCSRPGM